MQGQQGENFSLNLCEAEDDSGIKYLLWLLASKGSAVGKVKFDY